MAPPVAGRSGQEILLDGKGLVRADQAQVFVPPVGERAVVLVTTGYGTNMRNQFLFAEGKKVQGTDCYQMSPNIHFSPDGMHTIVDCQTQANSHLAIVDGKRGQEYQSLFYYAFTPDSLKPMYAAMQGAKTFVVVGDQESDGYQTLSTINVTDRPPIITGNGGKRFGFTAVDGNRCLASIDGKIQLGQLPASCPSQLDFSPDGSRYAYVLGNKPATVSVDGAPPLPVEATGFNQVNNPQGGVIRTSFLFSPDGKHFAYAAANPTTFAQGVVIDGKFATIPTNPGIALIYPAFTPDSKHFFVTARTPVPNQPAGLQLTVFVDGRPAAHFDGALNNLLMNPWAYEMGADGTFTFLVGDGNDLKRVRITPANDTSVDTMVAAAQAIK
jgi:hypothetical protein